MVLPREPNLNNSKKTQNYTVTASTHMLLFGCCVFVCLPTVCLGNCIFDPVNCRPRNAASYQTMESKQQYRTGNSVRTQLKTTKCSELLSIPTYCQFVLLHCLVIVKDLLFSVDENKF